MFFIAGVETNNNFKHSVQAFYRNNTDRLKLAGFNSLDADRQAQQKTDKILLQARIQQSVYKICGITSKL